MSKTPISKLLSPAVLLLGKLADSEKKLIVEKVQLWKQAYPELNISTTVTKIVPPEPLFEQAVSPVAYEPDIPAPTTTSIDDILFYDE